VSSCRLIDAEKASHTVARMADLLTVSRSRYYAWTKREQAGPSPAQQRRHQLTTKIITFHDASDQVYGSPRITVPDLAAATIPDLVKRRFDHDQLNQVWTSDITYLPTGQGWLYLCAVRDGGSRRVLGWLVQDHLRADLVDQALTMAVVLRGTLPDQVIFHADSEYGRAGVPGFPDSHADGPVRMLVSRLPRPS
jgi:transposase InsO family protein